MELVTERLILQPVQDCYASALYPLINDKAVADNLLNVPYPYPEQDYMSWVSECRESMEKCERLELAIFLKELGQPIGICSLMHIDWEEKNAELFYWLGKKYWNNNYMTEAVRRIVCYAFTDFGLEYIYGCCFANNVASARVMRKAGLKYMSHTRQAVQKGDKQLGVIYFDIARPEYQAMM